MVGWRIALWAAIVVVGAVFLYLVRGILFPFLLAFIISSLLDPSIRKLRLRGWPRGAAVSAVFAVFLVAMVGLGIWLTPIVSSQLRLLTSKFDGLTATLATTDESDNFFLRWNPVVQAELPARQSQFDRLLDQFRPQLDRLGLPSTRRAILDRYVEPHKGDIGRGVQAFFSGFLGIASTLASQLLFLLLVPLLVFMILLDMEQFKRRFAAWIPPAIRVSTLAILSDIGAVFVRYLRGVTITVLTYMVLMAFVLSFVGAPYAILLAILFGAIYLIPYLGALISSLVLFLVTGFSNRLGGPFFSFESPWVFAFVAVLIYMVTDFVFNQAVYPRLVGRSVGLHPVVSMFVILSGAVLFGLVGMIIAFPLAGAVKVILDRLMIISTKAHDELSLPSVPLRHRATSGH
jgi:predicted PurR-regulated permease PerM